MPVRVTCQITLSLVFALAARTADAAEFLPVVPFDGGQVVLPGDAADISTSMIVDRGQSVVGPAGWGLGDYRMTIDTGSASISASVDRQRVRIETYASLRDTYPFDFGGPEAESAVRDLWFRVMPTGDERIGDPVDIHLSLAWQAESSDGETPTSQAFAILSDATRPDVSGQLFGRNEEKSARVLVGGDYRLSLVHKTLAMNALVASSALLEAAFTPPQIVAPELQLAGDYNRDGVVNAADYSAWRDASDRPYDFNFDGDGNGRIDQGDRSIIGAWYGATLPGRRSVSVPEPASFAMFGALLACRISRRRRA